MKPDATTDSLRVAAPLRSVLAALVVVALLITLTVVPASAASRGCSVKDKATRRTYSTLQAAVNGARPKATLLVRGTCRGKTIVRKSLRIKGVRNARWGMPRLRTNGTPVLVVERGSRTRVASLLIERGKGVINRGTTTFVDVHVRGPAMSDGRGILNTGTLRLLGTSWVQRSTGVINAGHLTLGGTSHIQQNREGSIAVRNTGTIVMNDRSSVGANCSGPQGGWGCSAAGSSTRVGW